MQIASKLGASWLCLSHDFYYNTCMIKVRTVLKLVVFTRKENYEEIENVTCKGTVIAAY